jgi:hypothetical protein
MCDNWSFTQTPARKRGHALAMLRLHWHEAYAITWDDDAKEFVARRRDNDDPIRDASADKLRTKIRDDYSAEPVPREFRLDRSDHD